MAFVTAVTAGPAMAQGSAGGMRAQYLADFETMQTKFQELAGAMDADSYGWRPIEGVRTVSEVFMLIVAENYVVPAAWGATPPDGITPGFGLFTELPANVTDQADVLATLDTSAANLLDAVGSLSDAQMGDTFRIFGQEGVLQESLLAVVGEHARTPRAGHRVCPHERGGSAVDRAAGSVVGTPAPRDRTASCVPMPVRRGEHRK